MISKTKLFAATFFLTFNLFCIFSQPAKTPKTIYELLHLQPGGCELQSESEELVSEMIGGFESTENEKAPETDLVALMKTYTPLFQRDAELTTKFQKPTTDQVVFNNGFYLYKEGDLYGLKDNLNQILLVPKFHTVVPDTNNGFAAYENQLCNYYSTSGKKLLSNNYYSVRRTPKNTFIVQTKEGFGVLLANQKFLIKPAYQDIEAVMNKNLLYYRINRDADRTFYLPENGKDTIRVNCLGREGFIDNQYWESLGEIINIKTRRNIICEKGYYQEVVSAKHHLARITDNKSRKQYLIDFNGNLILNQPFESIGRFNDDDLSVVYTSNSSQTSYDRSEIYGIINPKGSWVIKPSYRSLEFVTRNLLSARGKNGLYGLINTHGDTLISFKYQGIKPVTDSIILCIKEVNKVIESDLYQLPERKLIKTQLPYARISPSELCGHSKYIAELKKGECVLNSNFEPVIPGVYGRIFYGPDKNTSFVAMDFYKEDVTTKQRLFDCHGNLQSFTINGEQYESYIEITRLSPDLRHILLSDNMGYFITASGKTVRNDSHWQNIEYSNAKDLFTTMIYGGKFGIVNSEGETVIPPVFEYISTFDNATGLARYDFNKLQKGLLTTNGELLFGTEYLETEVLCFDLFRVKKNDRWGVVNHNGKVIVPINYSKINVTGGIISAVSGNSTIRFDIKGNRIMR